MNKRIIAVLIIIGLVLLIVLLLFKKNNPITSLVCKKTAATACQFDHCGRCINTEEKDGTPISDYNDVIGDGCMIGLGDVKISGGYTCKKVNDTCVLRKTWRTPVCEILLGTYRERKKAEERGSQKVFYADDFGK